jgi:hypothetical protein
MRPELVKEFAAEYHRELNRLNATREGAYAQQKEELARIDRQIRAIIEAIKDGLRTPGMKDELLALETRKGELAAEVIRSHTSRRPRRPSSASSRPSRAPSLWHRRREARSIGALSGLYRGRRPGSACDAGWRYGQWSRFAPRINDTQKMTRKHERIDRFDRIIETGPAVTVGILVEAHGSGEQMRYTLSLPFFVALTCERPLLWIKSLSHQVGADVASTEAAGASHCDFHLAECLKYSRIELAADEIEPRIAAEDWMQQLTRKHACCSICSEIALSLEGPATTTNKIPLRASIGGGREQPLPHEPTPCLG